MPVTVVILAAGLGSRYRGTKQLEPVGPGGETLFDYTLADAVDAGADRVVMVVRAEIEDAVRHHVEATGPEVDVVYTRQDEWGPARPKPWGTAHALLAAAEAIRGPFLVANADDYYGRSSVAALVEQGAGLPADRALLAGFRLDRTLPEAGAVSRAICRVAGDELVSVTETHGIARTDGTIRAEEPPGPLDGGAVTSMNLWAFPHAVLTEVEAGFEAFLRDHGHDPSAEYLLPQLVQDLMAAGSLTVGVVPTDEAWTGITNPDDLAVTRARMAQLRPGG